MAWAHLVVLVQWAQGLVPILTKACRRNLLELGVIMIGSALIVTTLTLPFGQFVT